MGQKERKNKEVQKKETRSAERVSVVLGKPKPCTLVNLP